MAATDGQPNLDVSKAYQNKRAKMALSRSPEFMGVIVQIVCALEIQFKSALVLTNIASGTTCFA